MPCNSSGFGLGSVRAHRILLRRCVIPVAWGRVVTHERILPRAYNIGSSGFAENSNQTRLRILSSQLRSARFVDAKRTSSSPAGSHVGSDQPGLKTRKVLALRLGWHLIGFQPESMRAIS